MGAGPAATLATELEFGYRAERQLEVTRLSIALPPQQHAATSTSIAS